MLFSFSSFLIGQPLPCLFIFSGKDATKSWQGWADPNHQDVRYWRRYRDSCSHILGPPRNAFYSSSCQLVHRTKSLHNYLCVLHWILIAHTANRIIRRSLNLVNLTKLPASYFKVADRSLNTFGTWRASINSTQSLRKT